MQDNIPFITTGDGARIAYRWDGDAGLPVLALSNSIGTTLHMWDDTVPALARHFRVLRFDTRGHGASSVPAGPYCWTDSAATCSNCSTRWAWRGPTSSACRWAASWASGWACMRQNASTA